MGVVETASFSLDTYSAGEADGEKLALVLPGFLETKDRPYLKNHTDYLADLGYLAVSFDPPGTWGSGDNIEDYTVTNYLQAIDELIEHFGNRPVAVMGNSMGGRVALLAAMRNEHVGSVAAVATVFPYIRDRNRDSRTVKWQAEKERILRVESPQDPNQIIEFWLPYSHSEDAQKYDVPGSAGLRKLVKPKLFVIATRDTVVTPAEALETFEMAAEPKELRKLNAGHEYWRYPRHVQRINHMVGSFLRRADRMAPPE